MGSTAPRGSGSSEAPSPSAPPVCSREDGRTPALSAADVRERLSAARVARLATIGPSGPHIVPITFAAKGDILYSAVDAKPKRSRELARLRNIAASPAVSVLADAYDEDWSKLWWCRADGEALAVAEGRLLDAAVRALADKYPQYRDQAPAGPAIVIEVTRWSGWTAT